MGDITSMLVPTAENASRFYLMDMFIQHEKPILLYGPTATGKTLEISQLLFNGLKRTAAPIKLILSNSTTAHEVQETIESHLNVVQRKHWSPSNAQKLVVFVDNISSPQPGIVFFNKFSLISLKRFMVLNLH